MNTPKKETFAIYRHIKTRNLYELVAENIINTTNSANNQTMVLYMNKSGKAFVRETSEFFQKFRLYEPEK